MYKLDAGFVVAEDTGWCDRVYSKFVEETLKMDNVFRGICENPVFGFCGREGYSWLEFARLVYQRISNSMQDSRG